MNLDFNKLTLEQAKLFDSLRHNVVNDYNELSGNMLKDNNGSVEYLLSNVVSRNIYFSKFLYYLQCLKFLSETGLKAEDTIVVTDKILYDVIKHGTNCSVRLEGKDTVLFSFYRKVGSYLKTCYRFAACYLSKSTERKHKLVETNDLTLVDSFLHENSEKNGRYIDRYYCQMLDYVEKKDNIFYLLLYLPVPSKKKASVIQKGSATNLIYFFDLLKISDYLYALSMPFRKLLPKKEYSYCGFDLNPIIKKCSYSGNEYFMYGLLYYRFIRRAKEAGIRIKHVVDWFENQSYDKGLYLGMKQYYPKSTIYGYVGFIADYNASPHIIPTKEEYNCGIAPKLIHTCNQWLTNAFEKISGYAECSAMSSLRASKIWTLQRKAKGDNMFKILIPLSLNNAETVFKVEYFKIYVAQTQQRVKVILKPHPDTPKAFIDSLLSGIDGIEAVYGNIYDYLVDVDAMVATNSSTIYEALSMGIPVLSLYDSKGVFNCAKPDSIDDEMWIDVPTIEQLDDSIMLVAQKGRAYYNLKGDYLKELFFEPITRVKINNLLRIDDIQDY